LTSNPEIAYYRYVRTTKGLIARIANVRIVAIGYSAILVIANIRVRHIAYDRFVAFAYGTITQIKPPCDSINLSGSSRT
jgi:hypothetical protein